MMANEKSETSANLLTNSCEEQRDRELFDYMFVKKSSWKQHIRQFLVLQLMLMALYTSIVFLVLQRNVPLKSISRNQWSPAAPVENFGPKDLNLHLYQENTFKGGPSPRVDAAWDALFPNSYIRLSAAELERAGLTSTLIQDGSGDYLGALDVYHQLHCVRYIYEYIHRDYYTIRKTVIPDMDHIDHCLDMMRQVVMCLSDTTVMTFKFYDNYPKVWPEFKADHTCRNWQAVDEWAGQPGRRVDQSDMTAFNKWLENPNYTGNFTFDGHTET